MKFKTYLNEDNSLGNISWEGETKPTNKKRIWELIKKHPMKALVDYNTEHQFELDAELRALNVLSFEKNFEDYDLRR